VVLGPLAEEKKSSLRALVEICRALASAGMAAMRIDFRGTGDSPGCSEDVSLKSAVEDAVAAGREIKDACGCARVALVGLRFGAAAAVLAAGPAGADALVLVEPVVSGDAYVREMERQRSIRRMMTAGAVSAEKPARRDAAGGDAAEGATPADAFDLDGLALSGAFVESLRAMDLLAGARELRANNPAPALVLQVGARGAPRGELAALARELGARAEAIVAEPFWLRTEYVDPAPAVAAVA